MLSSSNPVSMTGPPHFVDLHVNPGESVSIQMLDGNETILRGPATITMVSQHTFPPVPMPVQVPPGHMVQQIVDENGTLRHIILSALNGQTGSGNTPSPSAPVQMIQTTPVSAQTAQTSSPQSSVPPPQPPPPLSSQAYPFPCCCSCCFCTSPVPGAAMSATGSGLCGGGGAPPAALLAGFPAPPGLSLTSSNNSARRRTSTSRSSYSFSKRQNNNNNNLNNGNISSSVSMHTSSNNTSCAGSAFMAGSPFHANASPTKAHKSGGSKSANLPTGIHMDTMSQMTMSTKMIIPPLNGHLAQAVPHQQQVLNLQSSDSSARTKPHQQTPGHMSSELSAGTSVASVVSDLLAKAAAGKNHNPGVQQQVSGCGGRTQPVSLSSSSSSAPLTLNCHSFRPSSGTSSGKPPATSSPCSTSGFPDSRHCLSNGLTSSSSVVSSSSVSPNSLDSSYASDKFSEVSSDRSDFIKSDSGLTDSGNEIMGLVQNGGLFTSRMTSPPTSSRPLSSDPQPASPARSKQRIRSQTEVTVWQRDGHPEEELLDKQPDSSSTEILSTDVSETSSPSGCESRLRVDCGHSPHHKSGGPVRTVSRDDLLVRSENGPKESPPSRKSSPLLANASAISSRGNLNRHASTCISGQTPIASTRTMIPHSQSSPSSPVILHQDQTTAAGRSASSPAPSSQSSPDKEKGKNRLHRLRTIDCVTDQTQLSSPPSSVSAVSLLSHHRRESKSCISNESDSDSSGTGSRKTGKPAVLQQQTTHKMRVRASKTKTTTDDGKQDIAENKSDFESNVTNGAQVNRNVCESEADVVENGAQVVPSEAEQPENVSVPPVTAVVPDPDETSDDVTPAVVEKQSVDAVDHDGGDAVIPEESDGEEESNMHKWWKSSPKLSLPCVQLLNLTYTALTATSVKLKWNMQPGTSAEQPHPLLLLLQEKASFTQHFIVEMVTMSSSSKSGSPAGDSDQRTGVGRTVYQGNANTCRVLHLQAAQQYSFRVRTVVEQHSPVSNLLTITTPEQALNSKHKHRAKPHQQSAVQQQAAQHDYHQQQQQQQGGSRCDKSDKGQTVDQSTSRTDDNPEKDDQKRAVLLLVLFTGFALLVAVMIQHLLSSS